MKDIGISKLFNQKNQKRRKDKRTKQPTNKAQANKNDQLKMTNEMNVTVLCNIHIFVVPAYSYIRS